MESEILKTTKRERRKAISNSDKIFTKNIENIIDNKQKSYTGIFITLLIVLIFLVLILGALTYKVIEKKEIYLRTIEKQPVIIKETNEIIKKEIHNYIIKGEKELVCLGKPGERKMICYKEMNATDA